MLTLLSLAVSTEAANSLPTMGKVRDFPESSPLALMLPACFRVEVGLSRARQKGCRKNQANLHPALQGKGVAVASLGAQRA